MNCSQLLSMKFPLISNFSLEVLLSCCFEDAGKFWGNECLDYGSSHFSVFPPTIFSTPRVVFLHANPILSFPCLKT